VAYVDTGAYMTELKAAVAPAQAYMLERLARREPAERLAVVLDIDETALSNISHMRAFDFAYLPVEWDAWVARGEAPSIAPVREFFQAARSLGLEVIFITGRRERDRPGTEKNLRSEGFGDYTALWFKPDSAKTTTEQFTAKPIKDWLCKTLDPAKGTVNGSKEPGPVSFDCFNLDGRRGSLFNLIASEVLIKEPIVAGDVFRFSGTIEKVMFVPDMKAVVLFKVQETALERLQHPQK
jgi:hypothetical protein